MSAVIGKIAHLSDLHLGRKGWPSYFSKDVADLLAEHLSSQAPKLIICTGDVVNGPTALWSFKQVQRFFSNLESRTNARILFVPGNHDYACFGFIGFKPISGWPARLMLRKWSIAEQPYHDEELKITVFGFDSNPTFAKWARGVITDHDIKRFASQAAALATKYPITYPSSLKIAAIHHHPVPIPYSGSDAKLLLENSASFLTEIAKHGVGLVLHGHKHFGGFARISFETGDSERGIAVLAAGSAGKFKDVEPRGSGYNLLTVWDDGTVEAEQFFARQSGTFGLGTASPIRCRTVEMENERLFELSCNQKGYHFKAVRWHVSVDPMFGDANYTIDYEGLKVAGPTPLSTFDVKHYTDAGYYGKVIAKSHDGSLKSIRTDTTYHAETEGSVNWSRADFHLDLGRDVTSVSDPVSFSLDIPIYAGFSMNEDEQRQRQAYAPGWEAVQILVSHPAEMVSLEFECEGFTFSPDEVDLLVLSPSGRRQSRLEHLARKMMYVSAHRIQVYFDHPRLGHHYEVRWRLHASEPIAFDSSVGYALVMRRHLIPKMVGGSNSELARKLLSTFTKMAGDFSRQFASRDPDEVIDLSLLLFDDERGVLKLAAGLFPEDNPIWNWEGFRPGIGLAGKALKSNQLFIYFRRNKRPEESEIYIAPGDAYGKEVLVQHEFLASVPVHLGGTTHHHILGVLNVGSSSPSSAVYEEARFFDLTSWLAEAEEEVASLLSSLVSGDSNSPVDG